MHRIQHRPILALVMAVSVFVALGRTPIAKACDRADFDQACLLESTRVNVAPKRFQAWPQEWHLVGKEIALSYFLPAPIAPGTLSAAAMRQVPSIACYAPGTPDHIVQVFDQSQWDEISPLAYFLGTRWSGGQGAPRALTWSFVPDGLFIDPRNAQDVGAPSELFSRMDGLFLGNRALWIDLMEQTFERWSELIGTSYTRVTNGVDDWDDGAAWGSAGSATRGDIRISMRNIDGGGGVLAFNFFPSNGDMVMDRSENWSQPADNHRYLRNTVLHEHGHGLGMFHVCPANNSKLMEPFLNTGFDGPQHDDIRGGQRHYGDPFESDNTPATATDLGVLISGVPVTPGIVPGADVGPNTSILSIDADGEQDYFLFTTSDPGDLTLTVTPLGLEYDSSSQNPDSSCNFGNFIQSLTIANLNVRLIDDDGFTILAMGETQPAGVAETISIALTQPGDYYVRVFEGSGVMENPTESQLYQLELMIETCSGNGDCDDGLFCTGEETCDNGNCVAGVDPCAGLECSESIDGCIALPVQFAPDLTPKNRFISFSPTGGPIAVAHQVELTASASFPGSVGVVKWVGEPFEGGCPGSCSGEFVAHLVDEPFAFYSSAWPAAVHIGDCGIVPDAEYEIRAILEGADPGVLANFSAPLALETVARPAPKFWGDTVGEFFFAFWTNPNGIVNFNDVTAVLQGFTSNPVAPHRTWLDLHDQGTNYLINFADIQLAIKAFQGELYPYAEPASCP